MNIAKFLRIAFVTEHRWLLSTWPYYMPWLINELIAFSSWAIIDSMSILRRYVEKNIDEFSRRFNVFFLCNFDRQNILAVSTYFFYVILIGEKSMPFRRILFDIISMSEKSTLFRCIFFDVILMGEKSTPFLCTFFKIVLIDERSWSFQCTSMHFGISFW